MHKTVPWEVIPYLEKKGIDPRKSMRTCNRHLLKTPRPMQLWRRGLWNSSAAGTAQSGRPLIKLHPFTVGLLMRRLTAQGIVKSVSISSDSIHTVLTEFLGMSKVSARWVPRMLASEQKLIRIAISKALLACFQVVTEGFHRRLVTRLNLASNLNQRSKANCKYSGFLPTNKFK